GDRQDRHTGDNQSGQLDQIARHQQRRLTYPSEGAGPDNGTALSMVNRQDPLENAASNAAAGGSNASRRTNCTASGAPISRSMPASSHSTEIGPSSPPA